MPGTTANYGWPTPDGSDLASTGDEVITSALSDVDAALKAEETARIAADAALRFPPPRGAVCFTWDDGYTASLAVAAIHEARNQRATFCITKDLVGTAGKISAAQVTALAAAGHEIAAHSVTHANFVTGLTAAQRAAELAESKAYIEGLTGEPCTTWVYPFGGAARNETTDREVYLVFERMLDVSGNYGRAFDPDFASPLTARMNLTGTAASHDYAKGLIRQAAARRVVVQMLCHQLDVGGAPTTAQYTELCDLADTLGVPVVRTDEALPGASTLADAGFEDASLGAWQTVGAELAESVLDTPAAGLSGVRSLHLSVTGGGFVYVTQDYEVRQGLSYTMSGRYRTAGTVGNFDLTVRARQHGNFTPDLGPTVGGTVNASASWARFSFDFTPAATTKYVSFDLLLLLGGTDSGEVWFDHVHIGPTLLGSFG